MGRWEKEQGDMVVGEVGLGDVGSSSWNWRMQSSHRSSNVHKIVGSDNRYQGGDN